MFALEFSCPSGATLAVWCTESSPQRGRNVTVVAPPLSSHAASGWALYTMTGRGRDPVPISAGADGELQIPRVSTSPTYVRQVKSV